MNIWATCAEVIVIEPNRRSPSSVPTTLPTKPPVPSIPTISASRSLGARSGDEGRRSAADARHGATIRNAQQVDGRAGVAGDSQMGEAGGHEQQRRAEPEQSGAVAVDPRAQDHPHGKAADHADADDPAEMEFGSAQQGDEVGVAEQHRHGRRHQQARQIRQPKRPIVGGWPLGLAGCGTVSARGRRRRRGGRSVGAEAEVIGAQDAASAGLPVRNRGRLWRGFGLSEVAFRVRSPSPAQEPTDARARTRTPGARRLGVWRIYPPPRGHRSGR